MCVWALCDETQILEERVFRIVGTGSPIFYDIGTEYKFIGTVPLCEGSLIFHVFEVL